VRFWHTLVRGLPASRARRIGAREAEQLLQGISTSADRSELLRLLALASAPPHPDELLGEEPALTAFRTARPDRRRARRVWRVVSRALAVKVLAGVGVLALGGVAVAAGTGNLPAQVQHGAHDLLSPLGVPVPDKTGTTGNPRGSASHPAPGHGPSATAVSPPAAFDAVSACQDWRAAKKDKQGKGMDPVRLQALESAAGGTQRVEGYCAKLLGADPAGSPSPTPQPSPTPKPHPDPKPSKTKHAAPTKSARV
jgi:hypothetical protein